AQVAVLLERTVDDAFELRRQIGIQPDRRNRSPRQNGFKDHGRRIATKGNSASRHFIEHCAKRKKVSAMVEFLPARLLGRHISNGAERRSRTGQMRRAYTCRW